jgi:uncharacterized protein
MTNPARTNSVHALTIGSMINGLGNMARIMDKAEKHAATQKIPLESFLQTRFYPDMFHFLQQVQYVCYLATDFARHFTNQPPPRVGYDETSWLELRKSLDTTAGYLQSVAPETVANKAGELLPTFMNQAKGMTAVAYAADVIIPDFHFHMVVAYALLRHNGVPLGKADYLGEIKSVDISAKTEAI